MFSAIIIALNIFPESQLSFHTSVDTLLAGKPHLNSNECVSATSGSKPYSFTRRSMVEQWTRCSGDSAHVDSRPDVT